MLTSMEQMSETSFSTRRITRHLVITAIVLGLVLEILGSVHEARGVAMQ